MVEVCGWVSRWSLEALFPLRIGDGGNLWVGEMVELGNSVSFKRIGDGGSLWVGETVELGSSISFKNWRWWQFMDRCHGVDEDQRWWKLEIRPWEIQRLERGCGLEMGIERATNLKKW